MTSLKEDGEKNIQDDLDWIEFEEPSAPKSGIRKYQTYLLPIGCLATAGILGRGLYYKIQGNKIKQLQFMKYRVLAHGLTLAVAVSGAFMQFSK